MPLWSRTAISAATILLSRLLRPTAPFFSHSLAKRNPRLSTSAPSLPCSSSEVYSRERIILLQHRQHLFQIDRGHMLLRIRSNLGTWKWTVPQIDSGTSATTMTNDDAITLRHVLEQHRVQWADKFHLANDRMCFDQAETRPVDWNKSLKKQGLSHGSMVFCRWSPIGEEGEEGPEVKISDHEAKHPAAAEQTGKVQGEVAGDSVGIAPDEEKKPAAKARPAISENNIVCLLDSSDDEGDDKSVQRSRKPATGGKRKRNMGDHATASSMTRTNKATKSSGLRQDDKAMVDGKFQIASYNVWFGPPDPGVGMVYPQERMAGIVEALQTAAIASPDAPLLFIGFQELTQGLAEYLRQDLSRLGYKLCTQPLGQGSYGVGVAVPTDLTVTDSKFVPYADSMMGRGILYVQTPSILFATTHLESYASNEYTGIDQRERQIIEAARFCESRLENTASLQMAVVTGDLNWDDERKSSTAPNRNLLSLLQGGWKDAGKPFDYTYDSKENPMLAGSLRRRFDRCLYLTNKRSSGDGAFQSLGLKKIGTEALVPTLVWNKKNPYKGTVKQVSVAPSDHFGIVVPFSK